MMRHTNIFLSIVLFSIFSACSITRTLDKTQGKPEITFDKKKDIQVPETAMAYMRLLEKQQSEGLTRKEEKKLKVYEVEYDSVDKAKLMVIKLNDVTVRPTLKVLPERSGKINLGFVVMVPDTILNSKWEVVIEPKMIKGDTSYNLEKVVFQGSQFDKKQKHRIAKYERRTETIKRMNSKNTKSSDLYQKRMERLFLIPVDAERSNAESSQYLSKLNRKDVFGPDKVNRRYRTNSVNDSILALRIKHFQTKSDSTISNHNTALQERAFVLRGGHKNRTYSKIEDERIAEDNNMRKSLFRKVYTSNAKFDASYAKTLERLQKANAYPQFRMDSVISKNEGKRNLRKQPSIRLDSVVNYRKGVSYYYSQLTSTDDNFDKYIYVNVDTYIRDAKGNTKGFPTSDTIKFKISSMDHFIDYSPHYVYRIVERVAHVNDKARVVFPVGKSNIIDTLGDNKQELSKLLNVMGKLLANDEFVVDSITLTAKSSPEGTVKLNNELSKDRAKMLSNYISDKNGAKAKRLLTTYAVGEDWNGLIQEITDEPNLSNKEGIFNVIARHRNLDEREYAISSKYKSEYKYIRDSIYPRLRVIDFKYYLHRKGMIKDTIHTTEIDPVYLDGIKALETHDYRKAIKIFTPYGEDFNRAIALMSLGFNKSALRILENNKSTANGEYLMAILYSRFEKYVEAYEHYHKACEMSPSLIQRGNLDPEVQNMLNNAAVEIMKKEDDAAKPQTIEDYYYAN